mmetsp:Transcript_6945/g.11153  ORF Transcript_6945/g.11153 Transcript_6945/m.11153 type:complete len:149 (+) Transcript_6945:918-1364(+)
MSHFKTSFKMLEANLETYKLKAKSEHVGAAKDHEIATLADHRYDKALLEELKKENQDLMDKVIKLQSEIDLYKAESSLEKKGIFKIIVDAITTGKRSEKAAPEVKRVLKKPQKPAKVFASCKSWIGQNPDLNEAIEKIEKLEMELEDL